MDFPGISCPKRFSSPSLPDVGGPLVMLEEDLCQGCLPGSVRTSHNNENGTLRPGVRAQGLRHLRNGWRTGPIPYLRQRLGPSAQ